MILKICLNHRDLTSSHKWAPSTTTSHQYISTSYLKMFYGYCPTILWCQTKYVEGVLRLDFFRILPPRLNELNRESSSRAAEWGAWLIILETGNVVVVFKISVSKELGLSSRSLFWSCFRKDNFGFFSVILFKALWLAGINAWRHILNVIFTLFADVLPRKTLPNKMIRFLIGLLRQPALFPLLYLGQDKLYFLPNFFKIHLQWFHRISS